MHTRLTRVPVCVCCCKVIFLEMVTFAILCTSALIRSMSAFSLMVETGLALVYVLIATILVRLRVVTVQPVGQWIHQPQPQSQP